MPIHSHYCSYFGIIFLVVCFNLCYCQTTISEAFYGGGGDDEFYSVFATSNERFLAVGYTESIVDKAKEILFRVIDTSGHVQIQRNIGGVGDDIANEAIETFDGGFAIVGGSNSKLEASIGQNDALLIKTDEAGEPLWYKLFGTSEDDIFNTIVQLPTGHFVLGGQFGNNGIIVCLDQWNGELLWDYMVQLEESSIINDITLTNNNTVIAIGTRGQGTPTSAFLLELSITGEIHRQVKTFPEEGLITGKTLIYDRHDDAILIGGQIETIRNGRDICIYKIDQNWNGIWKKNYGGPKDDNIHSLVSHYEHGYVFVGSIFRRGRFRSDGYAQFVNNDGSIYENSGIIAGRIQEDVFHDIAISSGGIVILAGASDTTSVGDRDPWINMFADDRMKHQVSPEAPTMLLEKPLWIKEMNDSLLSASERSYLYIPIKGEWRNQGNQLKAVIDKKSEIEGLSIPDTLLFSPNHLSTKGLIIPINATENLAGGNCLLDIEILNQYELSIAKSSYIIRTRGPQTPKLSINNEAFTTLQLGDKPDRNEPITLNIRISNSRNIATGSFWVRFITPDFIKPLSDHRLLLPQLLPDSDTTLSFTFEALSTYVPDSISIKTVAFNREFGCMVESISTILISNFSSENYRVITPLPQGNKGGGPVLFSSDMSLDVIWDTPDPVDEGGYIQECVERNVLIKLDILSPLELQKEDVQLYIGGNPAVAGHNINMHSTDFDPVPKYGKNRLQYRYTTEIMLEEGENKVQLFVEAGTDEGSSPPMIFNYTPPIRNLHLYSIGIPYDDLKRGQLDYTTKDAQDFARAYASQEGKLFNNIYTNIYVHPDSTTEDYLEGVIEQIYVAKLYEEITRADMIILFISSHGFVSQNRRVDFRIPGSNFDQILQQSTSIDFEQNILELLEPLEGIEVLIFVDACYSGAVANREIGTKNNDDPVDLEMSETIADLAKTASELQMVLSCSAGQLSYEDKQWNNAAFTKAILEAFANEEVPGDSGIIRADANNDKILCLGELYDFLRIRVPILVKERKPPVPTNQVPFIPSYQLSPDKDENTCIEVFRY